MIMLNLTKKILTVFLLLSALNAFASTNLFEKSPLQAQTYFREGIRQVKRKNYRAAIRSFRSAIQYDQNLGEAYLNIGACYERIGEFNKGIPYFEKAISVDDTNPRLLYLFGAALGRNNKRKEAVKYFEKAVYLDPKNPDYLYNLGVGYSSITQYANAAACFEEVSNIVSNNGAVWFNLGLARFFLFQTNKAYKAFEKVEIDSPVASRALYYQALIEKERGKYDTAISKIKMSIALEPDATDSQYLYALLLGKKGNYRNAINILEKIYRISDGDINALSKKLAMYYTKWAKNAYNLNEYETALHRYNQAGFYLPESADIQLKIAECAFKLSKNKIAKQALKRARRCAKNRYQEEKINELANKTQKNISNKK